MQNAKCKIEVYGLENLIEVKSFDFAVRIVNLYKHLSAEKNEYVMSKQLLRSGTSIGANVSEAERAQTRPDFNAKMNIALKEGNETYYWLKLLYKTSYLTQEEFNSIEKDIKELIAILVAICKKTNN
ncbi:MAG: four helix bundle protein [Ruminococcaceae bacterium]|nr:four helix bundle protein [Oscillospiraceae bacterium]